MMYKPFHKKYCLFFAAFFISMLFLSCNKKKNEIESSSLIENEISEGTHSWFSFSTSNFEQIELPQNAASIPARPWTESVRISSTGCAADELNQKAPPAYALVNRLGMIVFNGATPKLYKDVTLFNENTADNLFFETNSPIFSVYKSVFFNDSVGIAKSASEQSRPFIIEFNSETGLFFPLITYENLNLANNAQITDFTWNKKKFLCSIKETNNQKNTFSYISIEPEASLLSISPNSTQKAFSTGKSTADEFRSSQSPKDFSQAPTRLKSLLSTLPDTLPFFIECSFANGAFPSLYRQVDNTQALSLDAKAVISDTWALAIFSDGTSYFSGSCYNRPILLGGKTIAFRLPKLPENFKYSYFALSGTQLYVAWEETSFYQTARSGFISVNLDAVLYSKLRRESSNTEKGK